MEKKSEKSLRTRNNWMYYSPSYNQDGQNLGWSPLSWTILFVHSLHSKGTVLSGPVLILTHASKTSIVDQNSKTWTVNGKTWTPLFSGGDQNSSPGTLWSFLVHNLKSGCSACSALLPLIMRIPCVFFKEREWISGQYQQSGWGVTTILL